LSPFCSYTRKVWILEDSLSVELVAKFFELFQIKNFDELHMIVAYFNIHWCIGGELFGENANFLHP